MLCFVLIGTGMKINVQLDNLVKRNRHCTRQTYVVQIEPSLWYI
jgi:hypothetical protein